MKKEGRVFLEKYEAYKAFSKELKETSPFDVEEVLEDRPALLLEDSEFYEPEGEQAQRIKRKLGKAEEKINREVDRLRGEAEKLGGEPTFKTLSDRCSQLKTYFDRLESIESGLNREEKLPSRPEKLDLMHLRNQWERKLERGKKKSNHEQSGLEALQKRLQTYLEKEIDKLEQLEKNIDEKTVQLTGSNQLVERGDGTFQTFDWVQVEQDRVYRERIHVQEEQAERIDALVQFRGQCDSLLMSLNTEGLDWEDTIANAP